MATLFTKNSLENNRQNNVADVGNLIWLFTAIAKKLNIGVASVYRVLKAHKAANPDTVVIGSQATKKIAILDVHLIVENNSKFVRGKNESRRRIEETCFSSFDMVKKDKDGYEYTLKIPYETDSELEEIIDEMIGEAGYIADLKNGFIEMSFFEPSTDRSW